MNLDAYQNQALTTLRTDHDSVRRRIESDDQMILMHMAIGLLVEVTEYIEVLPSASPEKAIDELGDILWFVACAADTLGMPLSTLGKETVDPVIQTAPSHVNMLIFASRFLDMFKKSWIYGKSFDHGKAIECLRGVFQFAVRRASLHGVEFDEVLSKNIAKLGMRYEGAFSESAALMKKETGNE